MVFVLSESPVTLWFCWLGLFALYHFLAVSRAVFVRNKDLNPACFQAIKKSKSLKDSKSLKIGFKFNDSIFEKDVINFTPSFQYLVADHEMECCEDGY